MYSLFAKKTICYFLLSTSELDNFFKVKNVAQKTDDRMIKVYHGVHLQAVSKQSVHIHVLWKKSPLHFQILS